MYSLKACYVYVTVKQVCQLYLWKKFIYAPFQRIFIASGKYSPCGLSYLNCYLYYQSWMSEMLGQTKNGFLVQLLWKNNCFYFYRFIGFNYLRHIAKLVFFLFLPPYFTYFNFIYCIPLLFYLHFFYYLPFFFTFYFITPKSLTYF